MHEVDRRMSDQVVRAAREEQAHLVVDGEDGSVEADQGHPERAVAVRVVKPRVGLTSVGPHHGYPPSMGISSAAARQDVGNRSPGRYRGVWPAASAAKSAAPTMPASFSSCAVVTGVRTPSRWGKNFSPFLLTPPPRM